MKTLPICSTCKKSKIHVNGFLIVEGYSDIAFLSSFLEAKIVQIAGFSFSRRIKDYILELSKIANPIILVDQDEAGITIEKRLSKLLPGAAVVKVKSQANKRGKNGIAESDKKEVLQALDPYIIDPKTKEADILTSNDLLSVGLMGNGSKNRRDLLAKHLGLGECNAKTFLKRCNSLNIYKEDLERIMAENGN